MDSVDKFDCFISHSSKDTANAMSLVERLESREVKCWVAPRDIEAGSTYSDEIVEGIRTSASLIVLISKESLTSRHVQREVNLADDLRKPIYPVKLIDIEIYGGLKFYLSASQEVRLFEKTGDPVEKLISSIKAASGSRDQRPETTGSVIQAASSSRDQSPSVVEGEPTEAVNQAASSSQDQRPLVVEADINEATDQVASGSPQAHEVPVVANKPESPVTSDSHEYMKGVAEPEPRQVTKKLLPIASVSVLSLVAVLYVWNQNRADSESTSIASSDTNNSVAIIRDDPLVEPDRPAVVNEPAITGTTQSDANVALPAQNNQPATQDESVAFIEPEMVGIPSGEFLMGSENGDSTEQPVHLVAIAAFEMARHELSWGEWQTCESAGACSVLDRPDWIKELGAAEGARHPVVNVGWDQAQVYIDWINTVTDGGYRLPSEAEFEYTQRAGTEAEYPWEQTEQCEHSNAHDQAWQRQFPQRTRAIIADCDDGYIYTAPVGSYSANAFELYDVSGNAWEWTQDCRSYNYGEAPSDGSAWETGECALRVLRGGGWYSEPVNLRSANRYWNYWVGSLYGVGFRLARTL